MFEINYTSLNRILKFSRYKHNRSDIAHFLNYKSGAMKLRTLLCIITILFFQDAVAQQLSGVISIDGGATVTNNPDRKVTLRLLARGAKEMQISDNSSFTAARWQPYAPSLNYRINSQDDGLKTIYVKFRNGAGNISEVESAMIELDRTPPQEPSVAINGGLEYTNNKMRIVPLELSAIEASKMRISARADFYGSQWRPYREQISAFKLTAGDGKKEIYVQYMDLAGNATEAIRDEIILDTTPPLKPKILVEKGEKYATSSTVKIDIEVEGATEMIFKSERKWVPVKSPYELLIPGGDGEKVVAARFKDAVGNISTTASDYIIIDTTPPRNGIVTINKGTRYTKDHQVNVQCLASGASHVMVSNNPEFKGANWEAYRPVKSNWGIGEQDGTKTVYVKFKDQAGNESDVYQDDIILDNTPPSNLYVRISHPDASYDSLAQATVISDDAKVVDLDISADGADYMMVSNIQSFYEAKWELYKEEKLDWELGGKNDGERLVYVKFRDKAGNESTSVFDKAIVDTQEPVGGNIIIDKGAEFCINSDGEVDLEIFTRGSSEMMLSNNPNFQGGKWEPYQTSRKWRLEDEDGLRSVYVKFRDKAGNESEATTDFIRLDRIPPTGSIEINRGLSETTNNPDKIVQLRLRARDENKDASLMQVSNDDSFRNVRWRGYTEENVYWQLGGSDGLKQVYVRYKDEAGNISKIYGDTILLDRTPPKEGKISINGGDKLANNANAKVILSLFAENVSEMLISDDFFFRGADWEAYAESKEWLLKGPDGLKTIYAKFRDEIGNVSRVAYAKIGVDRQAPREGRVIVNNGAKYCTNIDKYVNLQLSVKEAKEMIISNSNTFENVEWRPYQYLVQNWILEGDDGEKQVWVKFRDEAENETPPISATIILDRQEPTNEEITINQGAEYTNDKSHRVQLELAAEDAIEMMISTRRTFKPGGKWEPVQPSKGWTLVGADGIKTLYAKFRDKAGNESATAVARILLDTEPPIPRYVRINDGATSTDSPQVVLSMEARDATYMMIANDPKFTNAYWEPYSISKTWTLTREDGLKRVFVKFKDNAQNESGHIFKDITLYSSN